MLESDSDVAARSGSMRLPLLEEPAVPTAPSVRRISVHSHSRSRTPSSSDAAPPTPTLTRMHISCYLLCLSGFLMSFKPSEPFLTHYLLEVKKLTQEEVNDDIYPVWTYSFLSCLLPAGVLAHACGPRVVVLVGFMARFITRLLLLFVGGVPAMQLMQFTFGLASACEPVFYALIYASLPRRDFTRFTGYQQGAILAGHLSAGVLGQVLVSSHVNLKVLFYISAVSVSAATVLFVFIRFPSQEELARQAREEAQVREREMQVATTENSLDHAAGADEAGAHGGDAEEAPPAEAAVAESSPSAATSVAPPKPSKSPMPATLFPSPAWSSSSPSTDAAVVDEEWIWTLKTRGWRALLRDLFSEYARPSVAYWSLWWLLGRAVTELVLNYNTTLFYERDPTMNYDGAVIATGRGVAGLAALLPARTGTPVGIPAFSLLASLDFVGATLLFLSAAMHSIYADYVLFVAFYGCMQFLYAMSSAAVASNVSSAARCTTVFTANTFFSLSLQTLTQTLIGHNVLHLAPKNKFFVFAAQLLAIAGLFALAALFFTGRVLTSLMGSRFAGTAWLGAGSEEEREATRAASLQAAEQEYSITAQIKDDRWREAIRQLQQEEQHEFVPRATTQRQQQSAAHSRDDEALLGAQGRRRLG